jgi:hypothetical protein
VDREEMIRILEEIIRDPDTNSTARCTAIRTLREIAPEPQQPVRSPPWIIQTAAWLEEPDAAPLPARRLRGLGLAPVSLVRRALPPIVRRQPTRLHGVSHRSLRETFAVTDIDDRLPRWELSITSIVGHPLMDHFVRDTGLGSESSPGS